MKIIKAENQENLSFVQAIHNGVIVTIQKMGSLVSVTTKGWVNVRFAKSQAKLLSEMINGNC